MSATNLAVKFDDAPETVGVEDMCLAQLFDAVMEQKPANIIVYDSYGDLTICSDDFMTVEPLAMKRENGSIEVMPPSNQSLARVAEVTEKLTKVLLASQPVATPA